MNAVYGSSSKATKTRRCGECEGCMRDDCGQCAACADKPRFGGRGSKKKVKNRLKYLQINNCKIKINNCKIKINDCKIKINNCKIKINNCEIKMNNVKVVCCADKPRFGGCGSKKKVWNYNECFLKFSSKYWIVRKYISLINIVTHRTPWNKIHSSG